MFQLKFDIAPFDQKFSFSHHVTLLGSCFSLNIGDKLKEYKISCLVNPHGTIYNPISLNRLIISTIHTPESYRIIEVGDVWQDLDAHSAIAGVNQEEVYSKRQYADSLLKSSLEKADWLVITPGTAWVYEYRNDQSIVANCHKIPTTSFTKRLLTIDEIVTCTIDTIQKVKAINPSLKILFTISPVRHVRDGLVENNRSKAILLTSIHEIVASRTDCFYFPAYEILIDQLRDYRFYAEDMIHPSQQAVDFIWKRLIENWMDKTTIEWIHTWEKILTGLKHRPIVQSSKGHLSHLLKLKEKLLEISKTMPVEEELTTVEMQLALFNK